MVAYLFVGIIAMVLHHVMCFCLNGRRVNTKSYSGLELSEQALIGAAGNAIASAACFAFGTAIGIVFVQFLWYSLRHKFHPIKHIEAVIECQSSPIHPASWEAWKAAWRLPLLALVSAAMTLVTVFAPGSLRTTTADYAFKAPCTIPLVNMSSGSLGSTADNTWTPSPAVKKMTLQNLFIGDLIPPPSPCGTCAYDLVFNGPGMNCSNTTDTFPWANFTAGSSTTDVLIWAGGHQLPVIVIATAEGYMLDYEAVTCNVYNTTYDTHIQHNGSITSVDVKSTTFNQALNLNDAQSDPDALGMYTVALALSQHLNGYGVVDVDKMIAVSLSDSNNHNVFYSALGGPNPDGSKTWKWDPEVLYSLPTLMQNVSISMLSNPLGGTMLSTQLECLYSTVTYDYNPMQLFVSYGIAIGVTVICILIGFWAVHKNGQEESLSIRRILVAVLNRKLFGQTLNENVMVRASNDPYGYLEPSRG